MFFGNLIILLKWEQNRIGGRDKLGHFYDQCWACGFIVGAAGVRCHNFFADSG